MAPWCNFERAAYYHNENRPPKGLALCLLAAFLALSCGGCGSEGKRNSQPAQGRAKAPAVTARVPEQSSSSEKRPATQKKDYLEIGFDLMERESLGPLKNGMSAANLLARFGEPEEKSEAIEWGADGLIHQTWYYRSLGIELDMARDGEPGADSGIGVTEFTVNMITVTAPCAYRTVRGVGIGTSRDEVLLLYADEIDPEPPQYPDCVIAGSCFGGIIFAINDGLVSEIFIGAAAE